MVEGAQQERWVVDAHRSRLSFSLRHIVVQRIEGYFARWGATLFVDRDPTVAFVGRGLDLDVERFPRATFRSSLVQLRDHHLTVDGRLDLHDLSRDIRVEIETGPTRYRAHATVDRQAFGLHGNQDMDIGGIVVCDQVEVRAELKVVRVADSGHGSPDVLPPLITGSGSGRTPHQRGGGIGGPPKRPMPHAELAADVPSLLGAAVPASAEPSRAARFLITLDAWAR